MMTEPCHRLLDLTGPLQIGGLPHLTTEFKVQNRDFVGCMRNVYIDQQFLDLNDNVWNNGTLEGCPPKKQFCSSSPCKNGGRFYLNFLFQLVVITDGKFFVVD